MGVRKLSRDEARRIAIRAQLLDAERPTDLLTVVEQLTFLQLDPTAAIAPSADLVAWSRLGGAYEPAHLDAGARRPHPVRAPRAAVAASSRSIVMVRPMADLGLHLAEMVALRTRPGRVLDWLEANDEFRRRVLDQLADVGPLLVQGHPRHLRGAVGVDRLDQRSQRDPDAGVPGLARRGRRRRAARAASASGTWPSGSTPPTSRCPPRTRRGSCSTSAGCGRSAWPDRRWSAWPVSPPRSRGRPASGGSTRRRRPRASRAAPRCCRRSTGWPTTACGRSSCSTSSTRSRCTSRRTSAGGATSRCRVLHGDRLVGKVDAIADRKAGVLQVHAVHPDVRFTKVMTKAVDAELAALAAWLGLDGVRSG